VFYYTEENNTEICLSSKMSSSNSKGSQVSTSNQTDIHSNTNGLQAVKKRMDSMTKAPIKAQVALPGGKNSNNQKKQPEEKS
jgi:hypothetical protein